MSAQVRVLNRMPEVRRLLFAGIYGAVRKRHPGEIGRLPDRSLILMEHRSDVETLASYCRVCGFDVRNALPGTWLHVQTFPMQAMLLAADDFPIPLAGTVHIANDMRLHRGVGVDEPLRFRVWADGLRAHARGAAFDMRGEAHVGDELVWQGSSTYLSRRASVAGQPVAAPRLPTPEAALSQRWQLPPGLGREYAAVSGDANPIHLSTLGARLFGFGRPIIHGMWTHARVLAGLGGTLPEGYRARVQFVKPIALPGVAGFAVERDAARWRVAVLSPGGKPHLVGDVTPC